MLETVKYLKTHTPDDKTTIVVTGNCPHYPNDATFIATRGSKNNKGPVKIQYYASGIFKNTIIYKCTFSKLDIKK